MYHKEKKSYFKILVGKGLYASYTSHLCDGHREGVCLEETRLFQTVSRDLVREMCLTISHILPSNSLIIFFVFLKVIALSQCSLLYFKATYPTQFTLQKGSACNTANILNLFILRFVLYAGLCGSLKFHFHS